MDAGTAVAAAGTLLAAFAIVAAWLTYRWQQVSARAGVLDLVDAETRMFLAWLVAEYPFGVERTGAWWSEVQLRQWIGDGLAPVPTVNRLSTVAVDAAIAQGPALFITPDLVYVLIQYRQRIEQLNQLIDNAAALQQAPDLWRRPLDEHQLKHFAQASAWIHWVGIGVGPGNAARGHPDGAHAFYVLARVAIEREIAVSGIDWWAWFVFGRVQPRQARPPLIQVVQEPATSDTGGIEG